MQERVLLILKLKKNISLYIAIIFTVLIFSSSVVSAINLEKGDRGNQVKKIQQRLSNIGYNIRVDGIYGFQTKKIVKDFQYNNDLKVDGIAGEDTINLLEKISEDIKYTIKKGDTLWNIADKFDTTVKSIKERNNIRDTKTISIGKTIYIPKTGSGGGRTENIYSQITHKVEPGDTLSSLAKRYGTSVETIKLANNLNGNIIFVGDKLVIPRMGKGNNKKFELNSNSLIWPVMGRISSDYGWRIHPVRNDKDFHNGLDIAVSLGTKIHAAASGKVIQSGWITGYGKTIIIDHGNNVKTLYAHNSNLLVSVGEYVNIGEPIARAGSTGSSTGSHLHFEIQRQEKAVNPLRYLP